MSDGEPFSFITYTHPDQQAHRLNRRKVLQHVGLHFRNRSRPAIRRAEERRAQSRAALRVQRQSADADADDGSTIPTFPSLLDSALSVPRDRSGYREDPFAVYPIEDSPAIAPALDYFITYYGTAHMIRPEFVTTAEQGSLLVRQYFQYAFQQPMLFEAIVALARANAMINQWADRQADSLSLYHYGQAIVKVRQALADPQACAEDAILFAIMSLIGINYLLNDLRAFHVNLMGLRQLVALRGGLDVVGWPLLAKPCLLGLEAFWAYISHQPHLMGSYAATPSASGAVIDDEPEASPPLREEPTFVEEDLLSKLPVGFRVLAEQGRISAPLAKLICEVAEFDLTLQHDSPTPFVHQAGVLKFSNFKTRDGREITVASNLQACEQLAGLLARSGISAVEKACCIGLFINLLCSTRSEQLSPLYFTQLQHHAGELLDMPLDDNDEDPAARDLLAWTNLNVASTMVPPGISDLPNDYRSDLRFALAAKTYDFFSATCDWDDMVVVLRRFIWSEACVAAWKDVWELGKRHHNNQTATG